MKATALREFDIPFVGLKLGEHVFTYEIGKSFFSLFADSMVQECDLYVHLTFDKKKETFFVLEFFVDGTVETTCDRCLNPVVLQINARNRMVVKFENQASRVDLDDPDVWLLEPQAVQLNVAQQLFELVNLQLPLRVTCDMDAMSEKTCDPSVTEQLRKLAQEQPPTTDPRWNKLKELGDQ